MMNDREPDTHTQETVGQQHKKQTVSKKHSSHAHAAQY